MKSKRTYYNGTYVNKVGKKLLGNYRIMMLLALFAAGIVVGARIINSENSEITDYLVDVFKSYTLQRSRQKLISSFCHSLLSVAVYTLGAYLLGLCVIGAPAILAVPFVKGLGLGIVMGYLYSAYAWKGVGYAVLIVFPGALISAFSLILCCSESFIMSLGLFSLIKGNKAPMISDFFKAYNIRYFVFLIISVFSALVDSVLAKAFGSLFGL